MLSLSIPILLIITVTATSTNTVLSALYSKTQPNVRRNLWLYNFIQYAFTMVSILLLSGGIKEISLFSFFLGVMLGIVVSIQFFMYLRALAVGPVSYTTVIVSLSAIIPTLSGQFWGEKITVLQWLGIILMAVCIILSPEHKKENEKSKSTLRWLVCALISSVLSGSVGVIQKIHQTSVHKSENAALLISAFATATIMSALFFVIDIQKNNNHEKYVFFDKNMIWIIPIITGVATAFPHIINLYLSGKLPTVVMFPTVNIAPMIISTVLAMTIFRERLSVIRWFGLGIGVISTLLVSGVLKF